MISGPQGTWFNDGTPANRIREFVLNIPDDCIDDIKRAMRVCGGPARIVGFGRDFGPLRFTNGEPPAPVMQHLDIRGAIVVREDGYYPPSSSARRAVKLADHADSVGTLRFTGGTMPPPPSPPARASEGQKIVCEVWMPRGFTLKE